MTNRAMRQELELYVHIPFCIRKCNYCDFLSFQGNETEQEDYAKALINEIRSYREFASSYRVSTVFLGGGTPSVLKASQTERIMDALSETFVIENNGEITTEANPGTLTRDKLKAYRSSGINRLSLGLQSMNNRELNCLGRIHTLEDFLESYHLAREGGFSNINIDLMSGIPCQTVGGWKENLEKVARLQPEHISAYSLIVEEGTPFYEQKLALPGEEEEREMYELTYRMLGEQGYIQYEISNYARPGYACRHNMGYWERKNYLGLGLGASSLMHEVRFSNTRVMDEYLKLCSDPKKMRRNIEVLDEKARMEEFMFLGLRMTEGVSGDTFQKTFGKSIVSIYGEPLKKYLDLNLLEREGDRIFLTREGISLSNMVMSDFLL